MARDQRQPKVHRRNGGHHPSTLQPPQGETLLNGNGPIVLASASRARGRILESAGVVHVRDAASIDERALKEKLRDDGASVETAATVLAEAKAAETAKRHPRSLVIGADQILECGGTWFEKPKDRAAAAETLKALRDRAHVLVSAVAVNRGGECVWRHVETARLTMRGFTDSFIGHYLEDAGPEVLESVGAYRLEGTGAQLFIRIEGDYFAILGLPLLPLLAFLREEGVLAG